MNKGITILILAVVLCAMGLVMYSHVSGKKGAPLTAQATEQSRNRGHGLSTPLRAPQGETGNLPSFAPPLSNASSTRQDGAPQPVTVRSGADGAPAQRIERNPQGNTAPRAETRTETAPKPTEKAPAPVATQKPTEPTQKAPEAQPKKEEPAKTAASSAPTLKPIPGLGQEPAQSAGAAKPNTQSAPADTAESNQSKAAANGTRTLQYIQLSPGDQGLQLRIDADGPIRCKAFTLSSPSRLVVDLSGTWKGMRAPSAPQGSVVQKVRLGQQASGPRLVLDLNAPLKNHRIERSGNSVKIIMQ